MKFNKKHIGIIVALILLGSTPFVLSATANDTKQLESHRDSAIQSLKVQALEVCKWQQALVLEKNKELTSSEDIINNAKDLQRVQVDCQGYAVEALVAAFQKTE